MSILLPPMTRSSRSSRFGRQRRHIRKLATLFRTVSILCALISVGFFISSRLEAKEIAHRQLMVGVGFLAVSPTLLALGTGLDWLKHRFYGRGRTSRSKAASAQNGNADDEDGLADGRHGSALVIALLLTAVITGVVLQVQWQARRSLNTAQNTLTQTTLHQAAAEGIRSALQRLAADDEPTVDHNRKFWATPQLVTNPVGIVVEVLITDENRYFDWNNLAIPPVGPQARSATDIAMDLMNLSGDYAPVARLDALTDWVDADSSGLWETPFYRQQTPPYEAANRPLYAWSELLWVHGFHRDLFRPRESTNVFAQAAAGLLDNFAVVPVSRERPVRININTASRDVLLAVLGIDHGYAVQALLALREGGPIRSLQPIRRMVEPSRQDVVERYLDVRSLFFCLEARAELNGQTEYIRALAQRGESGALNIVQWIF